MRLSKLGALLLSAALSVPAVAAELVVIVSSRSPVAQLRAEQVADIFLAEVARFPEGGEAVAIDQAINTPLRNEFYSKVAAKSPALMKAYWTKMIFTGRGQPPREMAGSAAVRKLVAENPNMIGYIERSALDASVKPVLVVH
ncbi:phosphate ABC transporter substrate-binding protein [Massilia sp. MB5]|uniref:phosphate ABC transporter substrate-binding protein n=1 Tax=unclassified Massilia TaxID=2609279 RepID=UPI00067DD62A|nr:MULTISPECIES: phosphate ABC transporter substrate-binding protein [unclassified Massilia]AKU21513.1 phosphate ABC transporter substrate-binding protein [Massilia sp. NR 4-1]UMR28906.1 phosphate ABC transporter substrate-binding protein [Massilia sp. MB5]